MESYSLIIHLQFTNWIWWTEPGPQLAWNRTSHQPYARSRFGSANARPVVAEAAVSTVTRLRNDQWTNAFARLFIGFAAAGPKVVTFLAVMADIVLTTLNAKYIHAAFGLRYLLANLDELKPRARLVEFDINEKPMDVAEVLLAREPKVIGFGVYIWNVAVTTKVVATLKRLRPEVIVVVGGPEVSFEVEQQEIVRLADYVITGEADLKFGELCRQLFKGEPPRQKVLAAELPELDRLVLPYDLYTDEDIAHRIIYVEASRGCPFTCEFCLSSLDIPVRQFPLSALLGGLRQLLDRGVRQFKFVDRTFNLNVNVSMAILEFFLAQHRQGLFVHFEMIPDRLPGSLRDIIAKFPPGTLQFEVGIQSFNPEVSKLISRRQDYNRLAENLRFLRRRTAVHVHADLIVGLPGESVVSFATGFDLLISLDPQEIQVGILKRLRGTPIVRHDAEWQMVYSPDPPYEILQNKLIDFATMQRMRRFARYWDLVGNSGNFVETVPLMWSVTDSPFAGFLHWSDWLHARIGRRHGIALPRLAELLFEFLTMELKLEPGDAAGSIWRDYQRGGRNDKPLFLRDHIGDAIVCAPHESSQMAFKRQRRHLNRPTLEHDVPGPRRDVETR
jgi:radical SAM superfamily enzyme YgiQ (UPF0313 family)